MKHFFKNKLTRYLVAGATILLLFTIIPKPELIQYKSANIVSEAVYWDGFGESGSLSDAHASFVKLDYETNHLHICYSLENVQNKMQPSNCQEFVVIQNDGYIGAMLHLMR